MKNPSLLPFPSMFLPSPTTAVPWLIHWHKAEIIPTNTSISTFEALFSETKTKGISTHDKNDTYCERSRVCAKLFVGLSGKLDCFPCSVAANVAIDQSYEKLQLVYADKRRAFPPSKFYLLCYSQK